MRNQGALVKKSHRHKNSVLNNSVRLSIALLLVMQLFTVITPACSTPSVNILSNTINIGDPASEAGHNLQGWGPIEPTTHGGNWGGGDDGNLRVVWFNNQGPVAIWHMDEGQGSTVEDESENNNDGTINGASWDTGKIGSGLYFNGTEGDYIDIADSPSLDITNAITVSAWINADNWDNPNGSPCNVRNIVDKGEHTSGKAYDLYVYENALHFRINKQSQGASSVTLPSLHEWHHVVGTYDGNIIKLYIDGIKVGEKNQHGVITTNDQPLYIGGGVNRNYWFNGSIDEVAIWDRALSPSEISDLYENVKDSEDLPTYIDESWATVDISIPADHTASVLKIRALDGIADDSFNVYINDNLVYSYADQTSTETWKTHSINVLPQLLKGDITVKIVCNASKWSGFDTWGQLGISWLKLYVREDTSTKVRFTTSNGKPLADGYIEYYLGGWKEFGTTDATGNISKIIPAGKFSFRITYDGARISKKQDIVDDPLVLFNTTKVTVRLQSSNGNNISNGIISYYASGWKNFGTTNETGNVTKELLARKYSFRAEWNDARVSKKQDIRNNATVIFNTTKVKVKLIDSIGNPIAGGKAYHYADGWKEFGITNSSGLAEKELLPRKYSFKMIYDDAANTIKQDISIDPVVVFSTINVTVKFQDSKASPLADGEVSYYSAGWKNMGTTNSNGFVYKEMLPRKYSFRINYDGAKLSKKQDVLVDPLVVFSTVEVKVRFQSSNGNNISTGIISYYAGGWKNFGTTNDSGNATKELIPKKYSFRLNWNSVSTSIKQDISTDPLVVFSTVKTTVHFENSSGSPINNTPTYYYAGGWQDFGITNDSGNATKELIPRRYSFKVTWDKASVSKKQDIRLDPIVIFKTINVTVKFLNDSDEGISSGVIKYYSKGWKNFGITNDSGITFNDLLPRKYTFRLIYNGSKVNRAQNVGDDPVVIFNTSLLYNKKPVSNSGGPYFNYTNESINFNGTESYDPDGHIVSYTWSLGDGTKLYGALVNHSYSLPGNYTVKLTVKDNYGASRTQKTFANITIKPAQTVLDNETDDNKYNGVSITSTSGYGGDGNSIPMAAADGPYEGFVGTEIAFNGSQSTDDGYIIEYVWDFGDGTKGNGKTINHIYNEIGIYIVTLTIYDNKGSSSTYTTSVDIREVPNNVPDQPTLHNKKKDGKNNYIFNISSFDLDGDYIRFHIYWGDGNSEITEFYPSNSELVISHSWDKAGEYLVKIQADDNKTLSKTTELTMSILSDKPANNVADNQDVLYPLFICIIIAFLTIGIILFFYKKHKDKTSYKKI